ncbi:MAG: GatB/YqeY domain-containing protein [Anaerolineae bacterium]|nr:GatB/YqeY domain-containing protein [Anaerolineae bacterium]
MSLQEQLAADLKVALREKDDARKSAIRMALAALKYARVAVNRDLTQDEMLGALSKEVAQRHKAMEEFRQGGRADLVERERIELDILEAYLPQPLTEDEIIELAREVIAEVGASGPKDMGQVMRAIMPRVRGRADGSHVNQIVRQLLQSGG